MPASIHSSTATSLVSDEADLSALEDSLKQIQSLSSSISTSMDKISTMNFNAINSISPLISKIEKLKIQQKNIDSTTKLIDEIKDYTIEIKDNITRLNKVENDLSSISRLNEYFNTLMKIANLRKELVSKKLDSYRGLMRDLDDNLRGSEVNLKFEFINRLKKVTTIEDKKKQTDVIQQSVMIYNFLNKNFNKQLLDNLVKERTAYNMSLMSSIILDTPTPSKDQNYIYDGFVPGVQGAPQKPTYLQFAGVINNALRNEASFLSQFFKDDFNTLRIALFKISTPLIELFISQTQSFIKFTEQHKFTYDTLNYELFAGLTLIIKTIEIYGTEIPQILLETQQSIHQRCENALRNFFVFVDQRYSELVISADHQTETLNSAFMSTMTRLNKFSKFHEYQLDHIKGSAINSWLPLNKPVGFQETKVSSNDPDFLLSSFYSDVIEWSFCLLSNKYQGRLSDEELGIMLLFNLDGLHNILESNKSSLRSILGQPGIQRYEKLKKKAIDKSTSEWMKLTTKIMGASTKQGDSYNLGHKEMGKLIDEFNKIFEENFRKFKMKNIPPFFKKQLAQDIYKMLAPAYRVFYAGLKMNSSNKSAMKHFKYDVAAFEQKLSGLA